MFPEIFQICIVIPKLMFYVPFNIPAIVYIVRADPGNVSFYSL